MTDFNPQQLGKIVLLTGIVISVVGMIIILLGKIGLLKLPGDLYFEGKNWKIYFPIVSCLIISIILSNLVNFLLSLIVLFAFLLLFHIEITFFILLLPLIILIQVFFLVGIGLISSALNVFYRDVTWIVNTLLLLWFYFTPIFYSTTMVPQRFLNLYMLNPMAALVTSYRDILLYGKPPNFIYLLITSLSSLILFFIGMKIYQRYSSVFTEEV